MPARKNERMESRVPSAMETINEHLVWHRSEPQRWHDKQKALHRLNLIHKMDTSGHGLGLNYHDCIDKQ